MNDPKPIQYWVDDRDYYGPYVYVGTKEASKGQADYDELVRRANLYDAMYAALTLARKKLDPTLTAMHPLSQIEVWMAVSKALEEADKKV